VIVLCPRNSHQSAAPTLAPHRDLKPDTETHNTGQLDRPNAQYEDLSRIRSQSIQNDHDLHERVMHYRSRQGQKHAPTNDVEGVRGTHKDTCFPPRFPEESLSVAYHHVVLLSAFQLLFDGRRVA
jgi:hypothetical protein